MVSSALCMQNGLARRGIPPTQRHLLVLLEVMAPTGAHTVAAELTTAIAARREDGTLCGAPLDSGRGKHPLTCAAGPTREARHDALRDFTASFHPKVSDYLACEEQRVTA